MERLLEVLRAEYKYSIGCLEAEQLNLRLGQLLRPDPHNGFDGYLVRSLYFDTPDDSDFFDKLGGYEVRRKIRLRIYSPNSATAKLELKEKQGSLQRKRSLTLERKSAERLSVGDYEPLLNEGSPFALEMYGLMKRLFYQPVCIVEYDRRAFIADTNNTRITLDSGLRANGANFDLFSPNAMLYPVGETGSVTLEVKYNNFLLSYIKDAVSTADRIAVSQSKYCAARNITLRNNI